MGVCQKPAKNSSESLLPHGAIPESNGQFLATLSVYQVTGFEKVLCGNKIKMAPTVKLVEEKEVSVSPNKTINIFSEWCKKLENPINDDDSPPF